MICEKCGEVCHCPMEPPPSPPPTASSPNAPDVTVLGESAQPEDVEAWRDEISARLHRYRSRRKAPPPRYPSLRLPFGPGAPALKAPVFEDSTSPVTEAVPVQVIVAPVEDETSMPPSEPSVQSASLPTVQATGAKIIEFPRFAWGPPPPPPDQLAEPVIDRPRILEVPELEPPPPALGGITIEPARSQEPEKRLGIDTPLQSAPIGRRILASLIDGVIIAAASSLFGFIFWKVVLLRPPQVQMLSLAAAIPCLFWASYQYLLIVYAGTTPGLHIVGLHLSRFDGTPARRSLRRWRVLASYLSAASLGMGYAWVFLDEDGLCWHDRITHTFLGPRKRHAKS